MQIYHKAEIGYKINNWCFGFQVSYIKVKGYEDGENVFTSKRRACDKRFTTLSFMANAYYDYQLTLCLF